MTITVAQMTKDELKSFIEITIEHKLREILLDPDEGFEMRQPVAKRLLKQKKLVEKGERGKPFDELMSSLNL
ncbi:MAG: hypothetical protein HYZ34_00895 [Ignavibacteriae bacterium]|nr:hypothetical protein [Ignavibacteriota bacterium]